MRRTCPRCKRDQIFSKDEKNGDVPCKFSGAHIRPASESVLGPDFNRFS